MYVKGLVIVRNWWRRGMGRIYVFFYHLQSVYTWHAMLIHDKLETVLFLLYFVWALTVKCLVVYVTDRPMVKPSVYYIAKQ